MNKNLFQSPGNTVTNNAGGKAYDLGPEHTLAQMACTGCISNTYYTSAETQLDEVLALAQKCSSEFIAKLAVYSRTSAYMKDMPALLVAVLASRSDEESQRLFGIIFSRVIDNTKMLLNFTQIIRSGKVGRKSFGSRPKRLMQSFLVNRDPNKLFYDSIGNSPSLGDVIKMVRPNPMSPEQDGLFAYLIGHTVKDDPSFKVLSDVDSRRSVFRGDLPRLVQEYESFKATKSGKVPNVPFQMLASIPDLPKETWVEIAKNGGWHMVRMNLNTFQRHGVFNDPKMVTFVANKLRDRDAIIKGKVFPYQLMAAYLNTTDVPAEIREALQDAMEIATENVPAFEGNVFILPDVSGSMSSPVTGYSGASSKVRCIDVAGLMAASVLRTSKLAKVLPFENRVVPITLNPRDSVMTNAVKLADVGGGGTNCAAPMKQIAHSGQKVDVVIYVSDNESWLQCCSNNAYRGTEVMQYWNIIKQSNPNAKLINIDITPSMTSQTKKNRPDILNVGGFSDNVFSVVNSFISEKKDWTEVIRSISL